MHTSPQETEMDSYPPVKGSAGRSDNLLLDDKDDLTGTGKNPLRNRARPSNSNMRQNDAKTDELTLIMATIIDLPTDNLAHNKQPKPRDS